MKNYFKGLLSGIILAIAAFSIIAFAQNIEAIFNEIRININGIDKVSWGEDYTLDNGNSVPYSIIYNDTTYLPMRKMSEFLGKTIYWNGDTKTVAITEPQTKGSQKIVAEKADLNDNVWIYYLFRTSEGTYLGVKDETRGFERVYQIAPAEQIDQCIAVNEDAIYFVRKSEKIENNWGWHQDNLYKLTFLNDENSQDGNIVYDMMKNHGGNYTGGYIAFDDDYLYYSGKSPGNGTKGFLYAVNLVTGEEVYYDCYRWTFIENIKIVKKDNDSTTLNYHWVTGTGPTFLCEISFFKDGELRFGEPEQIREIDK